MPTVVDKRSHKYLHYALSNKWSTQQFGMTVIVTALAYLLVGTTTSLQAVIAYNPGPAVDKEASMDVLKAGEAGNTTTTNQRANGNMTGTNSTS